MSIRLEAHMRRLVPALMILIAAGCNSGSEPSGDAYTIETVTAPPGKSLPGDSLTGIAVRVVGRGGLPIANVTVTWQGDGTTDPATTVTDENGLATTAWLLPQLQGLTIFNTSGPPGEFHLTASLGDVSTTVHTSAHAFAIEALDVGGFAACGISAQQLWCWGFDLSRFAVPPGNWKMSVPLALPQAGAVAAVALGDGAACVTSAVHMVLCSSYKTDKQFVAITGAPSLDHVVARGSYFCGLASDQTAWCWYTDFTAGPPHATQVSPSLHLVQIGTGGSYPGSTFACGLTAEGAAWCWGANDEGQLGNGTLTPSATPTQVSGRADYTQLLVSRRSACAVAPDNVIWCWGAPILLPAQSSVPAALTIDARGPLIALGDFDGYFLSSGELRQWYEGLTHADPDINTLGVTQLSDEGAMCILTPGHEAYCSWTLQYGGSESTVHPGALVPVPIPPSLLPD